MLGDASWRDQPRRWSRHLMTKSSWVERALEVPAAAISFAGVGVEALRGLVGLARSGTAPPDEAAKIRRTGGAAGNTGTVGLIKLDPNAELPAIERAIRDSITAIDGFGFLSSPPEGQEQNAHTVLIKPGVNWGINGYPTISSWESVYATTKMLWQPTPMGSDRSASNRSTCRTSTPPASAPRRSPRSTRTWAAPSADCLSHGRVLRRTTSHFATWCRLVLR